MKIKPAILREALIERSVPVLLYDYESIEANFKKFRKLTSENGSSWSMAVKALSRSEVMDVAKSYVDGFDISNLEEWSKIKSSVESFHTIWLTNANLARELDILLKEIGLNKTIVTVNDLKDYELVRAKKVPYVIRIASSDLTSQKGVSRFGLKLTDVDSLQKELLEDGNFRGFHVHQGLEDNNFKILSSIIENIREKTIPFQGKNYIFNLGGSFQDFSDDEITSALSSLKDLYKTHIEPGRALFKGAGFALAPIEKYIVEGDQLRLFTRLSFIGHLKWSKAGFAGILNMSENLETISVKTVVLEGPTCYEFDKSEPITVDTPLALTIGSQLVLENISGYSAEWNTSFNGVPLCEVKFVGRRRPDSP